MSEAPFENCRPPQKQRRTEATSDVKLNDDVRQIIAEFASDDAFLPLRLQSTRWCEAVAAAVTRLGVVSATRATLAPHIVMDPPTDATTCDAVVRAAMALSRHRRSVDLTVFRRLRTVDVALLFGSIQQVVCDDELRSRMVVDVSSLSELKTFPEVKLATKWAVGTLIMAPHVELPLRNLNAFVLRRLDLSQHRQRPFAVVFQHVDLVHILLPSKLVYTY